MSEKKKTLVLGIVGAVSALGLGWMFSRFLGDEEREGTPQAEVSVYWD
jgi:hypothetical protein